MQDVQDTLRTLDAIDTQSHELSEELLALLQKAPTLSKDSEWREIVNEILERIDPGVLTHHQKRRLERLGLPVRRSFSFHRKMAEESEAREAGMNPPSWELNSKTRAYKFADKLRVRRPETTPQALTFANIPQRFLSVVKAVSGTGGRGTYLIFSAERMRHVGDGKEFSSWAALEGHAHGLMSAGPRRVLDRWLVEELILENRVKEVPARDSKFSVFREKLSLM
jgi:hypothetical protein